VTQVEPLLRRLVGIEEIAGFLREGFVRALFVAVEHGRVERGQAHHLVQVPRDRVGALDTGEQAAMSLAQCEGCAVRSVDVQPQVVLFAEVSDGGDGIKAPGCGGAGARDHGDHLSARGTCAFVGGGQSAGIQAELVIDRDGHGTAGTPAHQLHGARDAVVRLLRDQHRHGRALPRAPDVVARHPLPCGQECGQVAQGAAVRQDAARARVEAQRARQELDHAYLHDCLELAHLEHGHAVVQERTRRFEQDRRR